MDLKKFMRFEDSDVEIIMIDGIAHFELISTGMALGYTKTAKGRLYPREERIEQILKNAEISTVVHDGQRYLTKDMLYEFMMEAHTAKCKEFKHWLKSEVLPQIEETGGYIQTDREAEFVDKYFPSFTEETKLSMVQDLRKQNDEYKRQNEKYKNQIAELEPQAQAYSDLMTAQGYLQFIDVAALVEIGRNTLFQFLRKCKVLTKQSNYNVPYGRFAKNGMFKVVTSRSENGHISSVTMVSPKGLNYIYKLMKKKDVLDDFNTTALLQKIKELEVA